MTVDYCTGEVAAEFEENFVDMFLGIEIPIRDVFFSIFYELFDVVENPDKLQRTPVGWKGRRTF